MPLKTYAPQVQTPDLLTRVQQAVENGDISQIQTHLKQLLPQLRAEGQNPLADYLQVQAHLLAGDLDKARIAVESLDLSEPTIRAHGGALKSQIYQFLGERAAEKGDFTAAYAWGKKALAAAPSPGLLDQVLRWHNHTPDGLATLFAAVQQAQKRVALAQTLEFPLPPDTPPAEIKAIVAQLRADAIHNAQAELAALLPRLDQARDFLTQAVRGLSGPTLLNKLERELSLAGLAEDAGDLQFAADILDQAQTALAGRSEDAALSAQAILAQRAFAVHLALKDFAGAGALLDKVEALFNHFPAADKAPMVKHITLLRAELSFAQSGDGQAFRETLATLALGVQDAPAVAAQAGLRLLGDPDVDPADAAGIAQKLIYHPDAEIASQALWLHGLRLLEAGEVISARDMFIRLESEYPQSAAAEVSRGFKPLKDARNCAGELTGDLNAQNLKAALSQAFVAEGNTYLRLGVYALGAAITFPWGLAAAVLIERGAAAAGDYDKIKMAYQTGITAATPARVGRQAWILTAEMAAALAGGFAGRLTGQLIRGAQAGANAGLGAIGRQAGTHAVEFLANDVIFRGTLAALTGHDTRWRGPEGFAVGMLGALLGAVRGLRASQLIRGDKLGAGSAFLAESSLALSADYMIRLGIAGAGYKKLHPGDPVEFAAHGLAFMARVRVSGDIAQGLVDHLNVSAQRGYDHLLTGLKAQVDALGIEPKAVTPQGIRVAMTAVPAPKGSGLAHAPTSTHFVEGNAKPEAVAALIRPGKIEILLETHNPAYLKAIVARLKNVDATVDILVGSDNTTITLRGHRGKVVAYEPAVAQKLGVALAEPAERLAQARLTPEEQPDLKLGRAQAQKMGPEVLEAYDQQAKVVITQKWVSLAREIRSWTPERQTRAVAAFAEKYAPESLVHAGLLKKVEANPQTQARGLLETLARTPGPVVVTDPGGPQKTPSGHVTPTTGPHKGETWSYNDPRGKHSEVAQYTAQELAAALKSPNPPKQVLRFIEKTKKADTEYGGQLSSEAHARYGELVLLALEHGTHVGQGYKVTVDFDVGINVKTGRVTQAVLLMGGRNSAHLVPVGQ